MILAASLALLVLQILSEEASNWLCNFVTISLDNGGIRYDLILFNDLFLPVVVIQYLVGFVISGRKVPEFTTHLLTKGNAQEVLAKQVYLEHQ